jgi:hypothetical protein
MDGLYNYKVQEPIFREYLQGMDDEELSSMARDFVFLCETAINGPWKIDAFKRDLIREEFSQRGKSELFQITQDFILNSLQRSCTATTNHQLERSTR